MDRRKKWALENAEWVKEYQKNYRKKNSEKIKEYFRKYRKENPEKMRELIMKSMNKKRSGGMREFVMERDNWECQNCGMSNEQHILAFNRQLTIDHIDGKGRYSKIPNNDPDNLQVLCLRCHGKKDHRRSLNNDKGGIKKE